MNTTTFPMPTITLHPLQIYISQITYYGPLVILCVGVIGCACSFITFTAPQLRKNSCAFYFLINTVFELLAITFGLLTNFAETLFGSTLANTNSVYCKIHTFLVYCIPLTATYLVLLTSFDRCMSSSVSASFRSFSQIKMAYRATMAAMAVSFLSCTYVLVSADVRPTCSTAPGSFAIFDTIFVIFWVGVIPHVLMLLFGCLTIMNIRRTKRQIGVQPLGNSIAASQSQRREKKTDAQLIVMMLVQVGLSTVLVMSFISAFATYILKPPVTFYDQILIAAIIMTTNLLFYVNYAKSFYLYILFSHLFRSIFVQRIRLIARKFLGQRVTLVAVGSKTNNAEVTAGSRAQRAGQPN